MTGQSEAPRLTRVAAILSQLWEREYSALAAAADAAAAGNSFVALLRRVRWVAGSDGGLHSPSDLYAPGARAAQEVLGQRAVLCAPGGVEGALAADLGVRTELSAWDLVRRIETWAGADVAAPLDLMTRVYTFIARCLRAGSDEGRAILAALSGMRCIFVPERHAASAFDKRKLRSLADGLKAFTLRDDGEPISGVWLQPRDCVWKDSSYLLDSLHCWKHGADMSFHISDAEHRLAASAFGCRALQAYYPSELAGLFCASASGGGGGLGVDETPKDEQYLDVWRAAAGVRPATRHSVACVLRVCVHFTYELDRRHRDWDHGADADDPASLPPLLRAVKAQAASLYVPNASGESLSPLSRVRWIADRERDQALVEGWFEPALLEHCVPLRHNGLHGVFDARFAPRRPARADQGAGEEEDAQVCVGKLDDRMAHFYAQVLQLPLLKDALTRRIVCEAAAPDPGAGAASGVDGERDLGAADGCALCHVAARTLQAWWVASAAETPSVSGGPGAAVGPVELGQRLGEAVRRLRLRRVAAVQICERWVAAAAAGAGWARDGGSAVEFRSRAVAPRRVTCGMDLEDAGGPLLLAAGASLRDCASGDVAAAFARLCGEVRGRCR